MNSLFNLMFGKKLAAETNQYLNQLRREPAASAHRQAEELLAQLRSEAGPKIDLGETSWKAPVTLPVAEVSGSHGLFTGGSGAGKTLACLLVIEALVNLLPQTKNIGFGVVDVAKPDLFLGTMALLAKRLAYLSARDPEAADELRRRIVIVDFSSRDPISPYNILAHWPNADPDFFASSRADLLLDLLPGGDKPSVAGSALLQRTILLLSECGLPITFANELLHDESFRGRLLAQCKNRSITDYFGRGFTEIPKVTVSALGRRMEALLGSQGVRSALHGSTAPDFRALQDGAAVVLVNCFGEHISASVRRLLQCLVVSDIHSSVFRRREKGNRVLWFFDESQNLFSVPALRDHMDDLLRLSRSFGSHYLLVTQNLTASVPDPRLLKVVSTNVKWSLSFRGEPSDCAFLKSALPVTGRKLQPRPDPFQERRAYSLSEERSMELDAIAHLPDRVAYLWLRNRSAQAFKIRTRALDIPQGSELEAAVDTVRRDAGIGSRMTLADHEQMIQQRDGQWLAEPQGNLGKTLAAKFRRLRGDQA
jgi:hypothetical protein